MADKTSKSNSKLRVEDGSITPDRVLAYPKGRCMSTGITSEVTPSRPQRFNGKGQLTAIAGIPLTSEPLPSVGESEDTFFSED